MPAVLALPALWGAVSAGAAGAATIYGANKAAGSAEQANATTNAANANAITEQQKQDAQQKAQFDENLAEQKRQWDATQSFNAAQWNADQARRAPYRAAGAQALAHLGDLLGTKFDPGIIPTATPYTPAPFNGTGVPTTPAPTSSPSSAAPFTTNAPMAAPTNPLPYGTQPTVKLSALMPPTSGLQSPGARQVVDPVTGQVTTVTN